MTERHLDHDWFPEPLPPNVRIGAGSWLYSSFAFRHFHSIRPDAVEIGEHTGVYNGTFFDLGPKGRISIGDYCSLVGVIFSTNATIEIGDYVFIAHEVVIADDDWATPHWLQSEPPAEPARMISDDVWIGANSQLVGGFGLAPGTVVGAGTTLRTVVTHRMVAGNPSRDIL